MKTFTPSLSFVKMSSHIPEAPPPPLGLDPGNSFAETHHRDVDKIGPLLG